MPNARSDLSARWPLWLAENGTYTRILRRSRSYQLPSKSFQDRNLLVHQLMNSVNLGAVGWRAQQLNNEVVALYASLGSKDQVESIPQPLTCF